MDILSAADPLNAANPSLHDVISTDTEMGYFAASSIVLGEMTSWYSSHTLKPEITWGKWSAASSLQPITGKQKITKWIKIKSDNQHFLDNNLLAGGVLTLCLPWPTRVGILHWGASAVEKPPLTVLVPLSITMLCPITPSCLLSGFMAGAEMEVVEGSGKLSN